MRKPLHRASLWGAPLCAALLWGLVLAQPAPAEWPAPAEIDPPPIDFDAPEPRREVLSNGIPVYLMEDRSLPLVQGVAYVMAPSIYDPQGQSGLAAMTAALLREGGTAGLSPDELDAKLENLAAAVEASASNTLASVGFDALADTVDEVLPIWHDVLVDPRFDEQRLEVLRQRQLEAIRRVADDPVDLAFREFQHRVAGGHPSGAYPTVESVSAIGRQDIAGFHEDYYGPANTVIAVSGDFDADEMLQELERLFGSWGNEVAAPPELPPLDPSPGPVIYYAPKDITQSVVLVGHPAVRAYTPEYNDLDVANHLLGAGGFGSRLFEEIRTRRGLAYSTGSLLSQGFQHPGIFAAYSISPAQATGAVLELLLAEIERLRQEEVAPDELERSRETILNQSLFRFTSPAAVAQRSARVELLGLESDYYERYLENLQEVTPQEIQQVAREQLHPEQAVILVVGDGEQFDRALEEFGPVETITLE